MEDRSYDYIWELRYDARPWLLNSERAGGKRGTGGHYGRAALVKEWRTTFAWLAKEARVPPLQWLTAEVQQICRTRKVPDTGSCFPAVKAAIDGLVDAGVLADDGPQFVRALTFLAPITEGVDALVLRVKGPQQ